MKKALLILLMFSCGNATAQKEIEKNIFMYGNPSNAIKGKIVLSFGVKDPKAELEIMEIFKEKGYGVISWRSLFFNGYEQNDKDFFETLKNNDIQTVISFNIDCNKNRKQNPYFRESVLENLNNSVYSRCRNHHGQGSTAEYAYSGSENGYVLEIFNDTNNYKKAITLIQGSIPGWMFSSDRNYAKKTAKFFIEAIKNEISD